MFRETGAAKANALSVVGGERTTVVSVETFLVVRATSIETAAAAAVIAAAAARTSAVGKEPHQGRCNVSLHLRVWPKGCSTPM